MSALLHRPPLPYAKMPVCKQADETRTSNNTLTADSTLKFAMEANKTYTFNCYVFYSTGATPDLKFGFDGPAGVTSVRIVRKHIVPGGTGYSGVSVATAYETTGVAITSSSTAPGYIELSGTIVNGSTAGNFVFTWAQNTSNAANTTIEKGSLLEYVKVNP